MATLTIKKLESLTPDKKGELLRDGDNLIGRVRVAKNGEVSVLFFWRYRFEGKQKDFTCGTWRKGVSLIEIRNARTEAKRKLDNGIDPSLERKAEKLSDKADKLEAIAAAQSRIDTLAQQDQRITVYDLFERWASVHLVTRKDSGKEIRRMFEKDVLPILGNMAVEDVRKGHVTAVTDAMLARGIGRMVKLVFSLMRQMFRFAQDRDIIENDPTAAIRKTAAFGKDTERERILSDEEIRDLAKKLPDANLLPSTVCAVWLCLATCCRIGELLKAQWCDVDFERKEWRIPAENSKNGKAHTVFLSDFALDQFRALQAFNGSWANCYPNRSGTNHVCPITVTKQLGDRQRISPPMSNRAAAKYASTLKLSGGLWTPHDLRRTGATLMTVLGVLPVVTERCLNHTEQNKVMRIYQRYGYEAEKREAWHKLGERLALLTRLDADNVVILRAVNQ